MRKIAATAALMVTALLPTLAGAQDRIWQRIDDSRMGEVRGNVHPLAQARYDHGRMSPATILPRIVMHFNRTAAQQAELDRLLAEQQDPASPNYHRWLTPEQFGERFGVSESDLAQVTEWLQARGFELVEKARSRTYVAFRGSAGQVDSVFRTEIHRYSVDGEEHFANASEPMVPAALSTMVQSFQGLHDFAPRPHGGVARPRLTSYITGNHFLAPDDFATIYNLQPLYNVGIDGAGQNIVVIGQSDFNVSDVQAFRRAAGLPANDPQKVLVPGSTNPGIVSRDVGEANLDIDWSGAVARGATVIYVFASAAASGAFGALTYAIDQNLASVLSSSYGNCERNLGSYENTLANITQQANVQGMTITAASGDTGAADCDPPQNNPNETVATQGLAVDVPAALPYVTGVGGTSYNEGNGTFWAAGDNIMSGSALSYIPEVAWNDSGSGFQGATGGGRSSVFPKPSWQTGTGVPSDGVRDVPDLALAASPGHDPYLICSGGSCVDGFRDAQTFFNVVGGTSAGAPAMAGIVALMNQYTGSAQGNINPRLYQLAAISSDAFHDITSGNNLVSCSGTNCVNGSMGFSTGAGYDQVTGLGSVDAFRLITEWANVDIRPNTVAFGNRLPNIADTRTVTLRNNNGAVLNVSGIGISGNFSQTNNCPAALSFGSSCTIQVTFVPTSLTLQTGSLTISGDDSASPHVIPLSGTGADLTISLARVVRPVHAQVNGAPPASSAQPAASVVAQAPSTSTTTARIVLPGTASAALMVSAKGGVVTLLNQQMAPMAVTIEVGSDFRQENDCGTELKAGASCSIKVTGETAGATGELKITTPAGTTKVAIGKDQSPR